MIDVMRSAGMKGGHSYAVHDSAQRPPDTRALQSFAAHCLWETHVVRGSISKCAAAKIYGLLGRRIGKTTIIRSPRLLRGQGKRDASGALPPSGVPLKGRFFREPYFYDYLTAQDFMTSTRGSSHPGPDGKRDGALLDRVGLHVGRDRPLRKSRRGYPARGARRRSWAIRVWCSTSRCPGLDSHRAAPSSATSSGTARARQDVSSLPYLQDAR